MKKLLFAACAAAMTFLAAGAQSRSDVNLDGAVNSADVVAIYNTIINGDAVGTTKQGLVVKGVAFTMVPVEGGSFMMGATAEQQDPYAYEKPAHQVTLSSYYIGQTEVTQELWEAVMGSNPSNWKGDRLPVEQVSWNDCQEFITKLNQLTGETFRLPTEAEWEFAARGGNKSMHYQYSGSNTLDDVAWYAGNSDSKTHAVASKQANELGIYDMSGNVWEWCQDYWGSYGSSAQTNPAGPASGTHRVLRGGGYFNDASRCRSADRSNLTPGGRSDYRGLRLVLSELTL